jgi:hypothetical protein
VLGPIGVPTPKLAEASKIMIVAQAEERRTAIGRGPARRAIGQRGLLER